MVRNLVGTFLLTGKGTVSQEDFRHILEARERTAAGPTAPASGLYLVEVEILARMRGRSIMRLIARVVMHEVRQE